MTKIKRNILLITISLIISVSIFIVASTKQSQTTDVNKYEQYYFKNINYNNIEKYVDKKSLSQIKIGIIDSEVEPDCISYFKGNLIQKFIVDTTNKNNFQSSHATHLCGIIAAPKNNTEVIGLANGAKIFCYVVSDGVKDIQTENIVKAINLAIEDHVDVINLSFGSYARNNDEEAVINKALKNNIVVVASYGNRGDNRGMYPSIYDGVISVGAVDEDDNLTTFSNYGPNVCVVASGTNILSITGVKKYEKLSGSSQSTAIVSSLVALIKSKNNLMTPTQVKNIIEISCKDIGAKGKDDYYGYGIVDFEKALKMSTDLNAG